MITAAGYLDEVKMLLARIDVATDGNDPLLLTYINKARRQVQDMTLSLFPERYGKILRTTIAATPDANTSIESSYIGYPISTYKISLPDDLIDIFEFLISYVDTATGVTYRQQARRLTKQEYWNVMMNAFNAPTPDRPIYALESTIAPVGKSALISGLNWEENGVNKTIWDIAGSVEAEIWYTAVLNDLELYDENMLTDVETTIPPDVEELVIYYAVFYFLQTVTRGVALNSIKKEIDMLLNMLKLNYTVKQKKAVEMLPSKEPLQGRDYGENMVQNGGQAQAQQQGQG